MGAIITHFMNSGPASLCAISMPLSDLESCRKLGAVGVISGHPMRCPGSTGRTSRIRANYSDSRSSGSILSDFNSGGRLNPRSNRTPISHNKLLAPCPRSQNRASLTHHMAPPLFNLKGFGSQQRPEAFVVTGVIIPIPRPSSPTTFINRCPSRPKLETKSVNRVADSRVESP